MEKKKFVLAVVDCTFHHCIAMWATSMCLSLFTNLSQLASTGEARQALYSVAK
jgi:hypothetical protein